jgi:glycosyltransferase involved in cell wall biosynthesis
MDIHPEVAVVTGMMPWNAVTRLLQKLDQWVCRRADRVQVLSRDMAAAYRDRRPNGESVPLVIIPNFGIEEFKNQSRTATERKGTGESESLFQILFAGNLGRFQALHEVIEAMTLLRNEPHLRLTLVGSGVLETRLKQMVRDRGLSNVEFQAYQAIDVARRMIRESDLCLVSLAPEVFRYAFPSKTTTIMAEGTPILAVVEQESELASMVAEKDLGWTCGQTPLAIADSIREAYRKRSQIPEMRKHIREIYAAELSADTVLPQWSQLLNQLNSNPFE